MHGLRPISLFFAAALVAGLIGCARVANESPRAGVPAVAEWQARKMVYLSGPKPHHIRAMRADQGAYVILQELALPQGTGVIGLQVDEARRELHVLTPQRTLALPITPSGQLVAENATAATAQAGNDCSEACKRGQVIAIVYR
jgi:hypothetical protein